MYKIYFNDKQILLAHESMRGWFGKDTAENLVVTYPGKTKFLLNYVDKVENSPDLKRLIILYPFPKQLKKDFFSLFRVVPAAGGVVLNADGKVLFIYRRGYWDLPKGKMELSESKRETALREVEEETGLTKLKLIQKLSVTHHIFRGLSGKRVLKPSHWYLMTSSTEEVNVQIEEDIEEAKWVDVTDKKALEKLRPIYINILDVIEELHNITR